MATLKGITAKKKKIKPVLLRKKSTANMLMEERHIGSEITEFPLGIITPQEIYQNLRYYGYFYENKDAKEWAMVWMKANRTKEEVSWFSKAEDWHINTTLGAMCKMSTNGAIFSAKESVWMNSKLESVIEAGKKIKETKAETPEKTSDTSGERLHDFLATIETKLDSFDSLESKGFSVFNELKRLEVPHSLAKSVIVHYTKLHEELEELLTKKTPDLVEGYRNMTLSSKKELFAYVSKILSDCEQYIDAKKAIRKPRATKIVPKTALLKSLKYQKDSEEYQVSSIDPINIIGSNQLILFNTKYRCIQYLESNAPEGFTVKGTTILNINETSSFKKTVRTSDLLKKVLGAGTKLGIKKAITEIKAVSGSCTGGSSNHRTQDTTLILKAYK